MPKPIRYIADQSLDELEGFAWGEPTFDSTVVVNTHRLRKLPLKQYRLEDLRLMIGQQVGLDYLIPRALSHLEAHPLAAGDFYPGDLLSAVLSVSEGYWATHLEQIPPLIRAIHGALARVQKVETCEELPAELHAALVRLTSITGRAQPATDD